MNKQTLIEDYKQTIERLQKECTEKTEFNIKLMKYVKELEDYLKLLRGLKSTFVVDDLVSINILKQKLEIAEKALQYYANSRLPDNLYTTEKIYSGSSIYTSNWAIRGDYNQAMFKVIYDSNTANTAIEEIKKVKFKLNEVKEVGENNET